MSKFCRQCGAQLEDDAVKCEACGLELQQEPENNQQSVNAEADAQPQEGAPAPKKLNNSAVNSESSFCTKASSPPIRLTNPSTS